MNQQVEPLGRRLDDRSFERLYRRHLPEVYRFVLRDVGNRADAEEVTQSAFLDAYRALRRGHAPEKPRAWLFGIAKNATRRRYRTLSRRPREVELEHEIAESVADEGRPQLDELRDIVGSLRPAHQQVLFLREIEGLSYAEISDRLELSQAAVETLLFRARRSLRERLEEEGIRPAAPAVVSRTGRLAGLAFLPAGLLRQLDRVALEAERSGLAIKTAAATAAVILGAGITVAVVPLGATGEREQAVTMPKAIAMPSTDTDLFTSVFSAPAVPGNDSAGTGAENPVKNSGGRPGGKNDVRAGNPTAGGATGSGVASGLELPAASVPAVSTPIGSTPAVSVPPVSTPPVLVPSVTTPPVSTPPAISIPPVTTPPTPASPLTTPPVSIPLVPAPALPQVDVPTVPDAPVSTGGLPGLP